MKVILSFLIGVLFMWVSEAIQTTTNKFQHPKFKISEESNTYIIPGRFLVEYTTRHDNDITHTDDILSTLNTKFQSMDLKVGDLVYSSSESNIRTMHVNDAALHENFLGTLVDHDNVVAVYPVTYIARPQAISNGFYSRVDTEITKKIQAHDLTQIDRLHKELNLTGKGIKICIIDTGVDYTHPALGGGFGPNHTISFGADLVGDHFDPMSSNNTTPDKNSTPMDNCSRLNRRSNGHGTHVAGIIAGNDKSNGFIGVAPDATIGFYRVFGCDGGSNSEIIMKAMVEAQKAKCDVINMSLGNSAPWSEQPHAAFAEKLAQQGISVVVSNGNSGRAGAFTVTDPAGAHDVLSVAAMSNPNFLGSLFSLESSSKKKYGPYSYQVAPEAENEIPDGQVVLGGSDPDTLSACESDTVNKDLKGKLALVKEGPCTITEQANHAAESGAIGLIYFNSQAKDITRAPYFNVSIPIASITAVSGHHLIHLLKNNAKEKFNMHFERSAFSFRSATGNTIADFSSMGPTNELDMKPSFAAIGSDVYSTLPQYLGGWGHKSGTSMACPYVAGTIALLREAFAAEDIPILTIHEKLQNYGKILKAYNKKDEFDSPLRQGAGLIQAYDAIKEPLHVSPSYISFNDTRSTSDYKSHSLKVTNTGSTSVEYRISTQSSASIAPYGEKNTDFQLISYANDKFYSSVKVKVEVDETTLMLQAGESRQVIVTVKIPEEYKDKEQIMYGGYVRLEPIEGVGSADINVPYFGVLGSLYNLPTFDTSKLNIKHQSGRVYSEKDTYHFKLSDESTAPIIGFHLTTPSRRFTIDLIDANEKRIGYVVPAFNYAERALNAIDVDELNPWTGTLMAADHVNSKPFIVEPGTYKVRWSALRMFGDMDKQGDWVVQTSCTIEIKP